jgi:hypothetical protein
VPATGQTSPAPAGWGPPDDGAAQALFDQFQQGSESDSKPETKPDARPESPPTPDKPAKQVRGIWVLIGVLIAALLLLAVPLAIVWFVTRSSTPSFDVAVNECVVQVDNGAKKADCGDPNAFTVVAKVDSTDQCPDKDQQPRIIVPTSGGRQQVLCLRPAAGG